jgi:competence protein ComEC
MKGRPLIPVALLYIAGILLAALPIPLEQLFIVAAALWILFPLLPTARRPLLCALFVLAGWINLAQRTEVLSPNDLRNVLGSCSEPVAIRGRLCETPSHRVHQFKGANTWITMAQIDISAINVKGPEWQPVSGRVMAVTDKYLPEEFFAGRTVEVHGALEPAPLPLADGLFDYRKYLDHLDIHYELRAQSIADWRILSPPAAPPLADRFCAWARKTLAKGLPAEDETLRLEWALTLGWRAALTEETSEPFVRASTYHIFAVDGLRIAIVSGIIFTLLRVLRVPRVFCGLVSVPFILFYAAMTGWPASAIRAIIMIVVVFGGWALNRPGDLINSLFAAALIILAWEPRQLFQAGFQLSVFVVLCIILIMPFFENIGARFFKPEPLLPENLEPRWRKCVRWFGQKGLALFLASVAAWLGSIPLVALYFHLVTPLSGPANELAVPLCVLVLISNLSSLLFAWIPLVSELFNHSGWFLMKCIQTTSQWSASWPGAYFYLPMPAIFTIALYYAILLSVLTGWLFKPKFRPEKICGLALLIMVWCALEAKELNATRLTILPLGNGFGAHLQPPQHGDNWVIDCGNNSAVGSVTKPFLRAHGVNQVSDFLLTHGEIAYSGGAKSFCDLFHPQNIFISPVRFRSPDYNSFVNVIKRNPVCRKPIQAGDHLGPWTVLYPDATKKPFSTGNDNALVLRTDLDGVRVLLFSDLGHFGQNALLAGTNDLRADIVVAGLPDKAEPFSEALLNAIQPSVIIVADPPKLHASENLKRRLLRHHVPVLYTAETKAVTLTTYPNHWELTTMDGTVISSADQHR